MNFSLAQAILVATVSGIATVMLSGLLTPGVAPLVVLSLIAPAPLFIAGFGWHPLVAALGGIISALIAQTAMGMTAGISFALLFALPVYAIAEFGRRRFGDYSGRPERDGINLGMVAVALVIYLPAVVTLSAMIIEPDYATHQMRMRRWIEIILRAVAQSGGIPPNADTGRVAQMMAAIMLPFGALTSFVSMILSASFALFVVEKSTRLSYARPEMKRLRLPGGALILLGLSIFLGMRDGYLGLFAEMVALSLIAAFVMQGLAVIHVRTIGIGNRGFLLGVIWAATVILWIIAAPIVLGIGMADHLFDFRRGRI